MSAETITIALLSAIVAGLLAIAQGIDKINALLTEIRDNLSSRR